MADVLGVVASAVGVADFGLKLSKNIYDYANSVAGASKRITYLGEHVDLTSKTIKELGDVFKDAKVQALLRAEAVDTAQKAMDHCDSIFKEMDAALSKSRSSRLAWPFRQVKVQELNADLDRLKTTLQLLLGVLEVARDVHRERVDRERFDELSNLIRARNEAEARYKAAVAADKNALSFPSINLAVEGRLPAVDTTREPSISTNASGQQSNNYSGTSISKDLDEDTEMTSADTPLDLTVESLDQAATHVNNLLGLIRRVQYGLVKGTPPSMAKKELENAYLDTRNTLDSLVLANGPQGSAMEDTTKYPPPLLPLASCGGPLAGELQPLFPSDSTPDQQSYSVGVSHSYAPPNPATRGVPQIQIPHYPSAPAPAAGSPPGFAGASSPGFSPSSPGYSPSYSPVSPSYSPTSPGFGTSSPGFAPTTPGFAPPAPGPQARGTSLPYGRQTAILIAQYRAALSQAQISGAPAPDRASCFAPDFPEAIKLRLMGLPQEQFLKACEVLLAKLNSQAQASSNNGPRPSMPAAGQQLQMPNAAGMDAALALAMAQHRASAAQAGMPGPSTPKRARHIPPEIPEAKRQKLMELPDEKYWGLVEVWRKQAALRAQREAMAQAQAQAQAMMNSRPQLGQPSGSELGQDTYPEKLPENPEADRKESEVKENQTNSKERSSSASSDGRPRLDGGHGPAYCLMRHWTTAFDED
ncbi:hypothetical protein IWX49DRAFT_618570 [Phyllosticta citricarpa]|uniref:Fungal N-terminal domain-containing protein n=2 Tax=Phyllosticta TaxID=121621 RepID=A0ABR1MPV6_9PEZI